MLFGCFFNSHFVFVSGKHISFLNACAFGFAVIKWAQAARAERAEALSPGQRPGLFCAQTCRPVRAKALKLQAIYKAFALTGRLADWHYTQGDALG